jgi:hypothetical protein
MVKHEATRLLSGGVKGQPETEDQVYVISRLAEVLGVQAEASQVADGDWKQGAWDEYFEELEASLDAQPILCFGYLTQCKRPLFGSTIDTSWAYYGYLFNEEVQNLLAGLNSAARSRPEIASDDFINGFHNQITGWLKQAQERGTDLWLFAA